MSPLHCALKYYVYIVLFCSESNLKTCKKYKNLSINKKTFLRCIDNLPKHLIVTKTKNCINISIEILIWANCDLNLYPAVKLKSKCAWKINLLNWSKALNMKSKVNHVAINRGVLLVEDVFIILLCSVPFQAPRQFKKNCCSY